MINEQDCFLLLIDLKRSTKLEGNRSMRVFEVISTSLKLLNERHVDELIIPLQHNYGDEISGFFKSPLPCFKTIQHLYIQLRDLVEFRYTVSQGGISFPSQKTSQVGGSAFKDANRIMEEELKAKRWRFCQWSLADREMNDVVSSLSNLCNELLSRSTPKQWSVYALLSSGLTPSQIAEEFGQTRESVYQLMTRGGIRYVIEAEDLISNLLTKFDSMRT